MQWFKSLRLGKQLISGFVFVALITAIVGVVGIVCIRKIQVADRLMYEKVTLPAGYIADISESFLKARMTVRVLSETPVAERPKIIAEIKKSNAEVAAKTELYEKSILTDKGRKDFENFKKIQAAYVQVFERGVILAESGKEDQLRELMRSDGKRAAEMYEQALNELRVRKTEYAKAVADENSTIAGSAFKVMALMIVFSVLAAIGLGILIRYVVVSRLGGEPADVVEITKRVAAGDLSIKLDLASKDPDSLIVAMGFMIENLRIMVSSTVDISGVIAAASSQLYQAAAQIADGAEEVASQAETVATASEEMSHTSNDIASNCGMAADASKHSADAANAGAIVVQETITGMNVIADRVRSTAKTIEALGAGSEQIGDIVGTIEDIADQTNLLALNAAIEAARAGEQGRGFAVVADEVRALAERTTKATHEISEMIKSIQSETRDAVKSMDEGVADVEKGAVSSRKSGEALQDILGSIGEVSMQISQIATAAEEQTATTNEVTMNVQQITSVITQTARSSEETADAASQLARQAEELQNLIKRFKLA